MVRSGGWSLKRQTCLPGRRGKLTHRESSRRRFQMFLLIDALIGTKCQKRRARSLCPRFLRERSSWRRRAWRVGADSRRRRASGGAASLDIYRMQIYSHRDFVTVDGAESLPAAWY